MFFLVTDFLKSSQSHWIHYTHNNLYIEGSTFHHSHLFILHFYESLSIFLPLFLPVKGNWNILLWFLALLFILGQSLLYPRSFLCVFSVSEYGNLLCCNYIYLYTPTPCEQASILTLPRITIISQVPYYLDQKKITCWVLKNSPLFGGNKGHRFLNPPRRGGRGEKTASTFSQNWTAEVDRCIMTRSAERGNWHMRSLCRHQCNFMASY